MCGISGIFGEGWTQSQLEAMVLEQNHRGPDANGIFIDSQRLAGLGHNRLSIIDLSPAGKQPMSSQDENLCIVFNGEIYNYLELRAELSDYPYHSRTDTEVILAAYRRWGRACLDRFVGMFAFLIWDKWNRTLFAARDRFGVKPLYFAHDHKGNLMIASEIKALHHAGIPQHPDEKTWATYLAGGLYEHNGQTFWRGINSLPAGHTLTWKDGRTQISLWYDIAERSGAEIDHRPDSEVEDQYLSLLNESVKLRFRSDVPVGINLSGGLDSSILLGLVKQLQGDQSEVKAYTFITGDPDYDELPWVHQMLAQTRHPSIACELNPVDVPDLALSVQSSQDEPFGGLPTLAYARLFETARAEGTIVLLDGQGLDEQWAGYDYYSSNGKDARLIQGTNERAVRPECLTKEFLGIAENFNPSQPYEDRLRNLQYRDARYTKLPRALRFNDRISMRASTELREPFLDHRLFELALRQPPERKINNGTHKWMLRRMVKRLLPDGIIESPKRPIQTPQREWLRGPLKEWANDMIEMAIKGYGDTWLNSRSIRESWLNFCSGKGDNSFFIWQWISLGLIGFRFPVSSFQHSLTGIQKLETGNRKPETE